MGNRANVVFTDGEEYSPAIYLHWNGGPESVYAFLKELNHRMKGRNTVSYMAARFTELVGEFIGGNLSLGIVNGPANDSPEAINAIYSDLGDNGVYLVNTKDGSMRRYGRPRGRPDVVRVSGGYESIEEQSQADVEEERKEAVNHSSNAIARFFASLSALQPTASRHRRTEPWAAR